MNKVSFKLPDKWYIKIDDENIGILNNYRINIIKYKPYEIPMREGYFYMEYSGQGLGVPLAECEIGVGEITTDQFIRYVLNESAPEPSVDDLDYLINLLNRLNE